MKTGLSIQEQSVEDYDRATQLEQGGGKIIATEDWSRFASPN